MAGCAMTTSYPCGPYLATQESTDASNSACRRCRGVDRLNSTGACTVSGWARMARFWLASFSRFAAWTDSAWRSSIAWGRDGAYHDDCDGHE